MVYDPDVFFSFFWPYPGWRFLEFSISPSNYQFGHQYRRGFSSYFLSMNHYTVIDLPLRVSLTFLVSFKRPLPIKFIYNYIYDNIIITPILNSLVFLGISISSSFLRPDKLFYKVVLTSYCMVTLFVFSILSFPSVPNLLFLYIYHTSSHIGHPLSFCVFSK